MTPLRIFISSVQREFAEERRILRDYLRDAPMMRRFFDVFLFEDSPAADRRPDHLYLEEVERCDLYVGLFGSEYGVEGESGRSPTEREFDRATAIGADRLIFLKRVDDDRRHPKMRALIGKAQTGLVRKRFRSPEELLTGLYASLVEYLSGKDLIRWGPFDAAPCMGATLENLDFPLIGRFIRRARRVRSFPLAEDTPPKILLEHLNLVNSGKITNAGVLVFGKHPQRFLISSEIKCAHFHGTRVAKPIPSYQVYKGTVFELVDQAVDFVLSKINRSIGERDRNARAPRTYEIPIKVVTEAVVNAVAHRDYTENGSVQVMLFADRLEVWNPGRLPKALTLDDLRVAHRSVPANPLLAESLYLTQYIERMGTGTLDMIARCREVGLSEPEFEVTQGFVTRIWRKVPKRRGDGLEGRQHDTTMDQARLGVHDGLDAKETAMLRACSQEDATRSHLLVAAGYRTRTASFKQRLKRLTQMDLLELTLPATPRSPSQRYRLTAKGRDALSVTDAYITMIKRVLSPAQARETMAYQAVPKASLDQAAIHEAKYGGLDSKETAILKACVHRAATRKELLAATGYTARSRPFKTKLQRLLQEGLVELTIPDKPRSPLQAYRLTAKGRDTFERIARRIPDQ